MRGSTWIAARPSPRRWTAAALALATTLGLVTAALAADRPRRVHVPQGFQPEGIETSGKRTFYVGSVSTGGIYRGNLKSGEGDLFIPGSEGRAAIGLGLGSGMLFVAGGSTGRAYVYDVASGEEIANLQLTEAESFVNDVDATGSAAFFTDSVNQVMYKVPIEEKGVGEPETITLTGDLVYEEGFNANGIESTADGSSLIIVQSNTGELFKVDPESGATSQIDLDGEAVPNGDGLLLDRPDRLWVLQNQQKLLTHVSLEADLSAGTVVSRKEIKGTDVPTTLARSGDHLALVNARFGHENPGSARYWVTQIKRAR